MFEVGYYRMEYKDIPGSTSGRRPLIQIFYKDHLLYKDICSYWVLDTLLELIKSDLQKLNSTPFSDLPLLINGDEFIRELVMTIKKKLLIIFGI